MKKKTAVILSIVCALIVLGTATFFIVRAAREKTVVVQGTYKASNGLDERAEFIFSIPNYTRGKESQKCSVTIECIEGIKPPQLYQIVCEGEIYSSAFDRFEMLAEDGTVNVVGEDTLFQNMIASPKKDAEDLEIGEEFEIKHQSGTLCARVTVKEVAVIWQLPERGK